MRTPGHMSWNPTAPQRPPPIQATASPATVPPRHNRWCGLLSNLEPRLPRSEPAARARAVLACAAGSISRGRGFLVSSSFDVAEKISCRGIVAVEPLQRVPDFLRLIAVAGVAEAG